MIRRVAYREVRAARLGRIKIRLDGLCTCKDTRVSAFREDVCGASVAQPQDAHHADATAKTRPNKATLGAAADGQHGRRSMWPSYRRTTRSRWRRRKLVCMREMPSSVDKQSTVCQCHDRDPGARACVQARKRTWHALEEAHVEAEPVGRQTNTHVRAMRAAEKAGSSCRCSTHSSHSTVCSTQRTRV